MLLYLAVYCGVYFSSHTRRLVQMYNESELINQGNFQLRYYRNKISAAFLAELPIKQLSSHRRS